MTASLKDKPVREVSHTVVIVAVSAFLLLVANQTFFHNVTNDYPFTVANIPFLASLAVVFLCFHLMLLSPFCGRHTTKPLLILLLLLSSQTAYFMDSYQVIIDEGMIDNMLKTDIHEAGDLLSLKQFLYLLFIGVLPSLFLYRLKLADTAIRASLLSRAKLFATALSLLVLIVLIFSNYYASFFREHKYLRSYSNPSYYIYSAFKYLNGQLSTQPQQLQTIGTDARIPSEDNHRELVLFVVGETARADRFSLNGYGKKTNPLLEQEKVISFSDVWSCGTSTAYSVPCMFSFYGQAEFDDSRAQATENVLDILKRSGVNILWLDNNSNSKGVAERVEYISYKTPANNPLCDTECRDEGMLQKLQSYIDAHPRGDIFIILHQMGNHGPAYYKRYPERFEKFTPVCKTNQLEECSSEEIGNAYDNAILYTDYFLSQAIQLLKHHSAENEFESILFYVSDHGESLGENHLYLHGLPYLFAPDTQKHVPLLVWFSENLIADEVDYDATRSRANNHFTHDNLFHSILGLLEVGTSVYDEKMDILAYDEEHED